MHIEKKFCFTHSSGEDIYLFTLRNDAGTEALITNFGAIITSLKLKMPDGSMNDIVLGFDKVEEYESEAYLSQYPWFGCAVGRCANRIKNAEFILYGEKFTLSKNNNGDQLHGGINGFDKKAWKIVSFNELPNPSLVLDYLSKDGEEGYPGFLEVRIRFEMNNDNELSYEYVASCDKPTIVNLTHHEYFNLDNCKGTIEKQQVKIHSSNTLDQDKNLVANGNLSKVSNTEYDFTTFHPIGERMNRKEGYDKSFVVDDYKNNGLMLVAEAYSDKSKTSLQVFSDEPVVHFYSGRWIPEVKGKENICYGPFSGFCLETHKHPNAINIPHFPNVILRRGEIYRQKTVYRISAL